MTNRYDVKTIAAVAVTLVLVVGLSYLGYNAYKKRELHKAVAVLLKDAGERMRDALSIEAGPAAADLEQTARKLDEHSAAVEKLFERFKRLELERDRPFSDDADSHLVTVREIFRKQAASHRFYQLHTDSLQALRDHMRSDDHTGAWVKQAVRAKERAEKDFRDYRLAVAAYATLLGSLPISQKKIERYVEPAALMDEVLLGKARERALETAKQAAVEMEKVRQLAAPK